MSTLDDINDELKEAAEEMLQHRILAYQEELAEEDSIAEMEETYINQCMWQEGC